MTLPRIGRPAGLPKTGGRQRGTPNKVTRSVIEKLEALGCDPIEGLARIAMQPSTSIPDKIRCYLELAQYVYPKRKPLEVSDDQDPVISVTTIVDSSNNFSEGAGEPDPQSP